MLQVKSDAILPQLGNTTAKLAGRVKQKWCVPLCLARMIRTDKTGYTPSDVPPIFARLNLDPEYWKLQVKEFGRLFANVAGSPKDVYEMRSLISKRRFYLKRFTPEPVQT